MLQLSYAWLAAAADAEARQLQPADATSDRGSNATKQKVSNAGRNLLYIISDDLRSELGRAHRDPSFQKLMAKSMMFDRTYVQQAVCNPSRQSFLTARRPDSTKVWNFKGHVRDHLPDVVSLPGAFKHAGFDTCGVGKVFHHKEGHSDDWACANTWYDPEDELTSAETFMLAPDHDYGDGKIMRRTTEKLEELARSGRQFMWTVGIRKPHLAWFYPQRFLNLNQGDAAPDPRPPANACKYSLYECTERVRVESGKHTPFEPLPRSTQASYRQQYRGAVTWVTYVVGTIFDHLEKLKLADRTMVVMHGDHGWNLGDHGMWCKQSNFETTTRAPLLLHVPWMPGTFGQRTNALVELIDVMPTVLELMGLTETVRDRAQRARSWDGTSFLPLLASPRTKYWKNATFSQYQRCGAAADGFTFEVTNPCEFVQPADFTYIGHSIRTDESSSLGAWRYTLWLEWDGTALRPKWNAAVGEELYHHRGDTEPDIDVRFEQANLAGDDALVSTKMALREALLAQVRA